MLITLCLFLAACLLGACRKDTPAVRLQIGDTIPPFEVRTAESVRVTNTTLLGKPSLIVHFSITCPDCQKELPQVQWFYEDHGRAVNVIAIARDDSAEDVAAYWKQHDLTIPYAAPGDRSIYDLFDRGSKSGVPQIYACNADGKVLYYAGDTRVFSANEIALWFAIK